MRSEIINSPPAANNSLKRNSLLLIKLPWIEWSIWRIQNAIFILTRAYKCKLWTNKLLEASGIKLNSVLENVYDKQEAANEKSSRQLSLWRRDGNHNSDNAEIARCLTPFCHPGSKVATASYPQKDGPHCPSWQLFLWILPVARIPRIKIVNWEVALPFSLGPYVVFGTVNMLWKINMWEVWNEKYRVLI